MIYSWHTKKVADGFEFTVYQLEPRNTVNDQGYYADRIILHTGIKSTRQAAKYQAQKLVRQYNRKDTNK